MDFLQTKKILNDEDQHKFSDIIFDASLESFTEDIITIYRSYDPNDENEKISEIIKIPWIFCKIYSTQRKNNYKWAESSYRLFARSCKRLFEFTLYIHSLQNECLDEAYLHYDHNVYNDLIDFYYREIDSLSHRGFNIIKSQSKNHIDFRDTFCNTLIKYPPKDTVQVPKRIQNLFKKFLLITPIIIRIYNLDDSKNTIEGRNSIGQWGKRESYETYETDFSETLIEKKRDYLCVENKWEDVGKAKSCSSPLLNGAAKEILGFQPVSENNSYKRVKIARAISSNIAKQNQKLISDYTIPVPKLLSGFLKSHIITNDMTFESVLFLSSLLLAIHHSELLKAMMGINERLKIDLQKHTLSIQLPNSIFAQPPQETARYTEQLKKSQTIKTILPINIVQLLLLLEKHVIYAIQNSSTLQEEIRSVFDRFSIDIEKSFIYEEFSSLLFTKKINKYFTESIKDKTLSEISAILDELSFLNTFFHDISYNLKNFVKIQIHNFKKTIVIHPDKLSHIHKRYLDTINPETITERLFFAHVQKSEVVKMCYTSMPAKYVLQAEWYLLFQNHLQIKELLNTKFTDNKNTSYRNTLNNEHKIVGSPFFVESGKAKKFFLSLSQAIHISNNTEVTKDCIRMIFIRYALSVLLGTRDFHHSCSLQNYSRRYNILTIQEKAKDTRSAKRIIPLCDTAVQLIELFHTIKKKYNYTENTPMLLTENEDCIKFEIMTQRNLIKWIEDNDLQIDTNFITYIPQNYGRHIIKSNTLNSYIKDEYIDAFLNHYSSGTEDQGMFSTFSNQTYFREIKIFMEDLAKDYLPAYGLVNLL